ncbi:MAG TPA: FAD-dependent oxidoreductase [Bosea sp. (in: a-proteobacteria)]|uniref:dihydrolipoyl dehydrogenase family protein n=1 Tax=Bosea sp. (in: a-proteobacteria) TaxID=1871050 RepID=UPI002E0F7409|nr:FAD-dependent oxidoreductase [Bosea sp. (in: a-proteobacteria)]
MTETAKALASPGPMTPDICVVGTGRGALTVATTAALFGVSVVLVEPAPTGASERARSNPASSAALAAAAEKLQAVREAQRFGISVTEPEIDMARLRAHRGHPAAALAPNGSRERLTALGIVVLQGSAHFLNRQTLAAGEHRIRARRFVIATGSQPAVPAIPGLAELPFLTGETLPSLQRRPERLLVLGGEPTGVALAQAMRRLGSEVVLILSGRLLPQEEPEAADLVRRALLRDGIELHEECTVLRAESARHRPRLLLASQAGEAEISIEGTHLLLASGHTPRLDGLDLDLAGIRSDAGGIAVDRGLRTANRRILAIGDCASIAGAPPSADAAEHHAGLAVRHALFRLPVNATSQAIPRLTLCQPEVASLGLSEEEARKQGAIGVLRWPYAENERAQAERRSEGLIKLITDRKGRILGVTIVGAQAGELIGLWCLTVQQRLAVKDVAGLVLPSPSLSEISKRAALSVQAPLASKPGIRRLIGFLRRFG